MTLDNAVTVVPAPTRTPADRNPALVYLSTLAPSGRRAQESALAAIADLVTEGKVDYVHFAWHNLRFQHTQAIRARLLALDVYAPATVNRFLSAMRGTLKMAWKLGLMTNEDYASATSVENVKYTSLLSGRMLEAGEVRALIGVCLADNGAHGLRDAAMIALMSATGARRSEVVALDLADYDLVQRQVKIINGKGGKSRTCYLGNNAHRHLVNWLQQRGDAPGALFTLITADATVTARALSAQSVYDMLLRRGKQAGLARFSPHDLRRTTVSEMLEHGVDAITVAGVVGHASVDTTMRYDRRGERAKQEATKLYDTPI